MPNEHERLSAGELKELKRNSEALAYSGPAIRRLIAEVEESRAALQKIYDTEVNPYTASIAGRALMKPETKGAVT